MILLALLKILALSMIYKKSMDVLFPAFLELPGSDTLPVPEVNFPGSRPTLEVRENLPPWLFWVDHSFE